MDSTNSSGNPSQTKSEKALSQGQHLLLVDQVERLRALSHLPEHDWLDLMAMTWKDYFLFRVGQRSLSDEQISGLSDYFHFSCETMVEEPLDFGSVVTFFAQKQNFNLPMPEKYQLAAHGRCRTPGTSFDFLEKKFGWRLKYDVLERFGLREEHFLDPFHKISTKLICDVTNYLATRQFKGADFFAMGAYSFNGNRASLIHQILSRLDSEAEVFSCLFDELVPLFESNCTYEFGMVSEHSGLLTMKTITEVAHEMGVKHVGNSGLCAIKSGIFATMPSYIDRPNAQITHIACEHRGDEACKFHIDFARQSERRPHYVG